MSYAFPDRDQQKPYEEGFPLPVAPSADQLPPGGGAQVLPHFQTFAQIVNYASRVYRWTHDEALRDNWTNALAIRRDPVIMDALRSRQLPTAQLAWHLECDDDEDQRQAEAVEKLTKIVQRIPRFQMLKMHLLEALWFGRYGTQLSFQWEFMKGAKFLTVRDFKPINGDKLVFRFSGQPGILVHQQYQGDYEQTDRGRAHFFDQFERDQLIIHRHEPEDADFFEPELGGSLQGVGIRGRIYWLWYLRSQVTSFLMDYLERCGAGGFTLYFYEAGSQTSANEVTQAIENQYRNNAILFPRYRDGTKGGPGIERIEPSVAGAQLMQALVTEYFDSVMRRYILGQNLTTEAGATGLGTGLADLHGETFARYIKYDAVNLQDTLTEQLIRVLQKNSPYCSLPPIRFVFDVDKPNANETLGAAQAFFEMGGTIDEDQLRSIIGLEKPAPGSAMLAKMGAMSPASAGSVPAGVPMLGQPGPDMGAGGQPPMDQGMPPEAMGQGQAPPMMMQRRGRRLKFTRQDFLNAVKEHFPDAETGQRTAVNQGDTDAGREGLVNDYVVDTPKHRIMLNYEPASNAATLDFRHHEPPEPGKGVWDARSEIGPESLPFVRNLRGFLGVLAKHGLGLNFSAEPHHQKAYRNLLKRWGWKRHKRTMPLGMVDPSETWVPPTYKPVQMERRGMPVKFASRKTRPKAWNPRPYLRAILHHFQQDRSGSGENVRVLAEAALEGDRDAMVVLADALQESKEPEWYDTIVTHGLAWPPWEGTGRANVHVAPKLSRHIIWPTQHYPELKAGYAERYSVYPSAPFFNTASQQHEWGHTGPAVHRDLTEEQLGQLRLRSPLRAERDDVHRYVVKPVRTPLTRQELALLSRPTAADLRDFPADGAERGKPVKFSSKKTLTAHPGILQQANSYLQKVGLPPHAAESPYLAVDEERSKRIADLYEQLHHNPSDPRVQRAYAAMQKEILAQYRHLAEQGVQFEPWEREGQPYANSQEMAEDARGGHLYFYTGGQFPQDHALAQPTGVKHKGRDLTYNDLFRAVHDYYGHALYGNQFGPRGEEHAYRTHTRMFSPTARPAMAAETRGQNSWVNYGKHIRESANPPAPANRPYADQKNAVLPDELLGD